MSVSSGRESDERPIFDLPRSEGQRRRSKRRLLRLKVGTMGRWSRAADPSPADRSGQAVEQRAMRYAKCGFRAAVYTTNSWRRVRNERSCWRRACPELIGLQRRPLRFHNKPAAAGHRSTSELLIVDGLTLWPAGVRLHIDKRRYSLRSGPWRKEGLFGVIACVWIASTSKAIPSSSRRSAAPCTRAARSF